MCLQGEMLPEGTGARGQRPPLILIKNVSVLVSYT
jgi:hypothetical protein